MIFGSHKKPSQFRPPTQKPRQSVTILRKSHVVPAHRCEINLDPRTIKSQFRVCLSITAQKTSVFTSYREIKSSSIPTNCHIDAPAQEPPKHKSFSTTAQKPSQFRSLHWCEVCFQVPSLTLKSSQFWTHTRKTNLISMLTLKPVGFRTAYKKWGNFDHLRNNRVYPRKSSSFSARAQKPFQFR